MESNDRKFKVKRPVIISVICVISFIMNGLVSANLLLSYNIAKLLPHHIYMLIMSSIIIVSMIGFWKMKKWGVVLYGAARLVGGLGIYFVLPGVQLWTSQTKPVLMVVNICSLAYGALVIVVGVINFSRMRW